MPSGSHRETGEAREQALTDFFMTLGAADALQIERRLQKDLSDDPIVVAFRRLVIERRDRLREVLSRHRKMLSATRSKP
jgi:hypothetical protein